MPPLERPFACAVILHCCFLCTFSAKSWLPSDSPGRNRLVEEAKIDPADLDRMTVTGSPQAASELILESYQRRETK